MASVLTPRSWFRKISSLLYPPKTKKEGLQKLSLPSSKKNHYDLQDIFNEVNTKYFCSSLALPITWSRKGNKQAKRVVRLGSYHLKTQKIKINPVLDSPHVPRYVVAFIVYHEVLHHLFPPLENPGSKRRIHHPLFMQKEREFEEYEEVQAFLKTSQKKLFFSKESLT